MKIPSDYKAGYEKARAVAPEMADNYIAHTLIGDPEGDALMEELKDMGQHGSSRFISMAMENIDGPELRDAPSSLVKFIQGMHPPPDWVD